MNKMTCTICGAEFNELEYVIIDNGNPVCPKCAESEKDSKQDE